MKIMTFNTQHCLNYVEQKIDFEIMAKAIRQCGADLVGLQEMRSKGKCADYADQAAELAKLSGLEHYYFAKAIDFGSSRPYGNALISKYPIVKAETVPIPDPPVRKYDGYYETRCVLKAVLENGLTVIVTHFGLNPDEQENAVNTVLNTLEEKNCILMGDFNVLPDNKILQPIRAKMKDAADLFGSPLLSFPSDKPDKKIDYIFVSNNIKIESADIPSIVASDHRPHTADILF